MAPGQLTREISLYSSSTNGFYRSTQDRVCLAILLSSYRITPPRSPLSVSQNGIVFNQSMNRDAWLIPCLYFACIRSNFKSMSFNWLQRHLTVHPALPDIVVLRLCMAHHIKADQGLALSTSPCRLSGPGDWQTKGLLMRLKFSHVQWNWAVPPKLFTWIVFN